ncbi:nuclear transport factor 2 family protein [Streptomyces echinoruber]|uniref:SnoaL-like domain-containing protein n=1 Tax=Streptomyces echinoruber TaxID=68898 RepID=A0A918RGE9_9ACTN|nr:nuclear transport factor 2 family protein [Streptomyces echinoruber]GGZ97805.1 hypothetical protein GCM10010389_41300 [Streptomyces echinoruber]
MRRDGERARNNVALVRRMYELFGSGELDFLQREVFAPDVVWTRPGHNPTGGVRQGPDEVISLFAGLSATGVSVELVRADAWGDDTVLEVHRVRGESREVLLDVFDCARYRVRDARIAEVRVYTSDQHAVDTYFWTAYDLAPRSDRWTG